MHRWPPLTSLLALFAGLALALPAAAYAGSCPNEALRTGRSASLPDCRAYELVTPRELGRTADMTFRDSQDRTIVSPEGERLALEAKAAFLEPGVSLSGTDATFTRTPTGWTMQTAATSVTAGELLKPELFSSDLTRIALRSETQREPTPYNLAFGPVGGPYSTLTIPSAFSEGTALIGANAGVFGVAPFSHVFFASPDRELLPPGREREAAEEADPGMKDLYEWVEGRLRLVNVTDEGKALNACGAKLGNGGVTDETNGGGASINAVSADGSRAFFLSPSRTEVTGCPEPQLYMRVDGKETVNISEPQGVSIPLSQRGQVRFIGASPDGSRVYFATPTALTPDAGTGAGSYCLYEYDTEAPAGHKLTLIDNQADQTTEPFNPGFDVSADGSVVYYAAAGGIYRYDAETGIKSFVAVPSIPKAATEPWYVTPKGDFFVFAAGQGGGPAVEFEGPHGREEELRGVGHDELYRYDAADGSVMCVSCGSGVAPARGEQAEPEGTNGLLPTPNLSRSAVSISDDGERAFFQTSARLVPQDANEDTPQQEEGIEIENGADVYEWEAADTEEAPGVFCRVANGCTHLISAGEDVGPERFLGASTSGHDLFFSSAAQLLPDATPEFTNIYDARVEGGFPRAAPGVECTSCQGVGNPVPQFGAPASATLTGAGNPPLPPPATTSTRPAASTTARKLAKALQACHKDRNKIKRRRCEAQAHTKYARRRTK
jgi:hypothetical protein